MIRTILSIVFFFSLNLAYAKSTPIKPTSVFFEANSADIIEGVYSDKENENWNYDLIKLKVVGQYDEAVYLYSNIQPGKYAYRFAKISKKIVSFNNCSFVTLEGRLDDVRYEVKKQTDRRLLISKKGAETAEIRLTSVLPEKYI